MIPEGIIPATTRSGVQAIKGFVCLTAGVSRWNLFTVFGYAWVAIALWSS